ncbi:hypothetical protein KCU65_g310, partial [Aureobasidium melanogenum]
MMSYLSIRKLRQYLDRKLDKQRRRNELQDSQWEDLKQGAQRIVRWVKNFTADQHEIDTEHARKIRELEKEDAHLGSLIDTGREDRIVGDDMLEERIQVLEDVLGIERDEEESSPSPRHSALTQGPDRLTLLDQEVERMKRQFDYELKALEARVNTRPSGQVVQSYEVDEGIDRPRSSNKKRKVMETNDRQSRTNDRPRLPRITSPGVWTSEYKLYIEQEHRLVSVDSGPLVDAWVRQCNRWSSMNPNWQQHKPFETCLNSMLSMRYAGMVEGPEDTLAFACSDCERGQKFCVVYDSQRGLLKLLPRRNAPQPGGHHVTDLATFIDPIQRPMH